MADIKEFVFKWRLEPPGLVPESYSAEAGDALVVTVGPDRIEVRVWATQGEKDAFEQAAQELANNLAGTLSAQHGGAVDTFGLVTETHHCDPGHPRTDVEAHLVGGQVRTAAGELGFELRDADGNVIDSSEMRCRTERERQQHRNIFIASRACNDPALAQMIEYRRKYVRDPFGRLHHLYDILEVAKRKYGGRQQAAKALGISDGDLAALGRIANDENP